MIAPSSFKPFWLATLTLALAACGQQSIPTKAADHAATSPSPAAMAASGDIQRTLTLPPSDGGPLTLRVDGEGNLYSIHSRSLGNGEGDDQKYETILWKYTPDGRVVWEKALAQTKSYDFTVNKSGTVAFVGYRKEDTPCDHPLPSLYICDYTGVAQKYDSNGGLIVSLERGSEQPNDYPNFGAVALDEQGDLYTFGSGEIQKFNDAGQEVWGTRFESTEKFVANNYYPKLKVDRQNNVYFVRSNIVWIDPQNASLTKQAVFFSKLDAAGTPVFIRDWHQGDYSVPRAMGLSDDGNVYTLWADLSDGPNGKAFLKKYGQDGTWKFNKFLGLTAGSGALAPIGGMTTSADSAYVYGGDANYDGMTSNRNEPYLTKYDASGARVWTKDLKPTIQDGVIDDVTAAPSGNLYVSYRRGDERFVAVVTP